MTAGGPRTLDVSTLFPHPYQFHSLVYIAHHRPHSSGDCCRCHCRCCYNSFPLLISGWAYRLWAAHDSCRIGAGLKRVLLWISWLEEVVLKRWSTSSVVEGTKIAIDCIENFDLKAQQHTRSTRKIMYPHDAHLKSWRWRKRVCKLLYCRQRLILSLLVVIVTAESAEDCRLRV